MSEFVAISYRKHGSERNAEGIKLVEKNDGLYLHIWEERRYKHISGEIIDAVEKYVPVIREISTFVLREDTDGTPIIMSVYEIKDMREFMKCTFPIRSVGIDVLPHAGDEFSIFQNL